MKYDLIFSPRFESELNNAFEYISHTLYAPAAAKKLMSEIDRSINFAASDPYMYPLCPEPLSLFGFRKITVKNYIAVYSVNEEKKTVNFLGFFFGKRNYTDILM